MDESIVCRWGENDDEVLAALKRWLPKDEVALGPGWAGVRDVIINGEARRTRPGTQIRYSAALQTVTFHVPKLP